MTGKPVESGAYDDQWLSSAWGDRANRELLSGADIKPRPRVCRALELADFQLGQCVLDIACGRGEIPALAAELGAHALGLDYSAAALDFAARLRSARLKNQESKHRMELIRSDACVLPFRDDSFDRITLLDIIEHLTPVQLRVMFREIRRVLSPTGYVVLHTLPNRWVYDFTFPLLHRLSGRFPADPRSDSERKIHINEQDVIGLHRTLSACGLEHRLWLEQLMPAQARWNRRADTYGDNRDSVYPVLEGSIGRAMELASLTPLKLLLCNDIFGLAWKGTDRAGRGQRLPLALTERLLLVSARSQ